MKTFLFKHLLRPLQQRAPPPVDSWQESSGQPSMEIMRRELAVLAADMVGAQAYIGQFGMNGGPISLGRAERKLLRNRIEDSALPCIVIDPRPGLHIIDMNDAYGAATLTDRRSITGEKLFHVFPDNPDTPRAEGVSNLYESIRKAAQSGQPHTMATQRYDIRDATGRFIERYWRSVNTPIFDDAGELLYLLHFAGALNKDDIAPYTRMIASARNHAP